MVEKESQQHLKRFGNEAMFDLTGEEATVSYIRHKREEGVVSPCLEDNVTPPHQMLACLLCLALSLVLLGLLLSSLLVAPIGSWFKVQGDLGEEEDAEKRQDKEGSFSGGSFQKCGSGALK